MKIKPDRLILIAIGLTIAGGLLLFQFYQNKVTFLIDGKAYSGLIYGLTVGDALKAVHVTLAPEDRFYQSSDTWLWENPIIRINRAVQVLIQDSDRNYSLQTAEKITANILELAGLRLFPGDLVSYQGTPIDPGFVLPPSASYTLYLKKAITLTVKDSGRTNTYYSTAPDLGKALQQAGVELEPLDRLSISPDTPLTSPLTVTIIHPATIEVTLAGKIQSVQTGAITVGQALHQAGIVLVGLDYSIPADNLPLPANGQIRVVRVREVVTLDQKTIPFTTTTQADPQTELDQRSVIQPGQTGLTVSRIRIRYEDSKEVSRQVDSEWQVRPAKPRILGYGTKIVIHTTVVDGVTISYYRAVTVYATSYSPCDSGTCSYYTANGAKVGKGVIGTSPAWYNLLKGQQVYVPGYGAGIIADYGDVGSHRIDLGYSDSDFVGWHKNVTLYFLAPAPASVPWILP